MQPYYARIDLFDLNQGQLDHLCFGELEPENVEIRPVVVSYTARSDSSHFLLHHPSKSHLGCRYVVHLCDSSNMRVVPQTDTRQTSQWRIGRVRHIVLAAHVARGRVPSQRGDGAWVVAAVPVDRVAALVDGRWVRFHIILL